MCGIIGISAKRAVNQDIYDGLTVLQHRGQDAAGIATIEGTEFHIFKNNGLLRDAIRTRHMRDLKGNAGLGHVRYPTAGCSSAREAQPFYVNSPFGITLVHNGNLVNAEKLEKEIYAEDRRHLNTTSDSEILLNILAHEIAKFPGKQLKKEEIFKAMKEVYKRCSGGFAVVAIIAGHGMLAFRDPYAIRPLILGKKSTSFGTEYIVASESVALDSLGYQVVRDVKPGEAMYFPFNNDEMYSEVCAAKTEYKPCIFEYVYLARPDSMIDGISVHKMRLRMGKYLAEKIMKNINPKDIDVVMPIPDSGRTAAIELAEVLGVKYREGFIKNRYIGRTFIMPGQEIRKKSIRQKLNPIQLEFQGKNVLLVDDSIVRGNTSKKIVEMAREAGAAKVYFVSAAPMVKYPNVYGIDIPTRKELIAHSLNEEEIAQFMGADAVFYQDMKDLTQSGFDGNPDLDGFEDSVFTGEYCTGDITSEYLNTIEMTRNDAAKSDSERKSFDDSYQAETDNLTLI